MLRSFQVTNHRSLAEGQELRLTKGSGPVAVPVTAIHGAAAAGKTNLIDALGQMRDAVLHSVTGWDPYAGPARAPHLGFPDRPSEFVASFVAEGVPYTYGFRLDNADVTAEWLYTQPRSRKRIVFERNGAQIKIGPMFEAARYGITALVPLVRPNALLLSLAGQMYADALVPAYRWFESMLEVQLGPANPAAVAHRLGGHISRSPENAARLLLLLRTADLGITDLLIAENDPMYADYLRDLDADIAGIGKQIELCATSPDHADRLLQENGVTVVLLERELTNLKAARDALYARMVARRGVGLRLVHDGIDNPFDITDESTATLSLLRVLPTMLDALDSGRVLAVDDIGAHLPAEETDRLIQLFQNPETNSHGAQLIYTTNNRALIDRSNGRSARTRSVVWQVRRTEHGTSELATV
ncbi:AAA family ATPase [Nocardia iowensis]|uniref:ATP-binding protein n=1 Tax=Nocardia iowensis TaxID=204891 RepID=A0ABX8RN53_NOCIO|nr:ATP-binding protein [Nocardia iowensis]QXN89850.1 ATP-binding protein [Nocardia iowensis]